MQAASIQQKVKAFPLYQGTSGCDYHRVKLPFIAGADLYSSQYSRPFDPSKLSSFLEEADVVVFNRSYPGGANEIKRLKKKGIKFVADLDDWIELPEYHPNFYQYSRSWGGIILDCLEAADLVTVTTNRLYTKVKEYHRNVHVVPNALPYGKGQFRVHPDPDFKVDERFRFIYTGQSSHLNDVKLIRPEIKRIKSIPGVGFSLAGWKDQPIWRAIESVFSDLPGYKRIKAHDLSNYMQVYDGAQCSIVPLQDNDFNSHKSNLKLLEAAAKQIPVIVSSVAPYIDDAEAPVLWVEQPGDWVKHMKRLSENPNEAKDLGMKLSEWARANYHLDHWNKVRFQLYESLKS